MIFSVSLHKQFSNNEINNTVSMNKLKTKKCSYEVFSSSIFILLSLTGLICFVSLFVYIYLVLLLWCGRFTTEAATNFLTNEIKL